MRNFNEIGIVWLVVSLMLPTSTANAAAGVSRDAGQRSGPELAVYKGAGCDGKKRIAAFEAWLGRPVDRVIDFLARDRWATVISSGKWVSHCWRGTPYKVTFSIPMLPADKESTLEAGMNGAYNDYFRELANTFVANGQGDAILRIGWEFNGGWYPWAAKRNPDAWIALWRHIVTTMRSVPGARFRFDWNPTLGWQQIPPDKVYPGDDYVDIIGLDVYNQTWEKTATTPELRWRDLMDRSYGLRWHADFARQHGKPMSFAEWGTGTRADGHGGGDDPLFVRNMTEWIKEHDVLYHGYWDYPAKDFNAELSSGQFPLSGAELRRAFGKP